MAQAGQTGVTRGQSLATHLLEGGHITPWRLLRSAPFVVGAAYALRPLPSRPPDHASQLAPRKPSLRYARHVGGRSQLKVSVRCLTAELSEGVPTMMRRSLSAVMAILISTWGSSLKAGDLVFHTTKVCQLTGTQDREPPGRPTGLNYPV